MATSPSPRPAAAKRRSPHAAWRRTQHLPLSLALLVATPLILLLPRPAAAGTVRVTLSPQRLALGDTAQLTFTVARSDLGSVQLSPRFALDNFQIVGGPARQESMSWINGDLSRTFALTWYLAPLRPGKARVHDIKLLTDKEPLALPDQEAWVEETAEGSPDAGSRTPPADPFDQLFRDLFSHRREAAQGLPQILLRAEVSPARPWVGQQLLYTLYLLAERRSPGEGRLMVETIFPRRVPAFQGFWSQEVQLPETGRAEIVELDGKLWWRQPVLQRALFAYEPGAHHIESAEADLRVLYLRPMGFGFGEEPVRPAGGLRRESNPMQVAVQPLPPAPAGFAGAVGQLRAKSELTPTHVKAGEVALLTAELAGNGNLTGLPDPQIRPLPGVLVSPPQESSKQKTEGTRVESSRIWTWTLVPRRGGQWTLPPLEWVTFDPVRGAYQAVRTTEQKLAAAPAPAAPSPPVVPAPPRLVARPPAWGGPLTWAVGGAAATLLLVGAALLVGRLLRADHEARRRLLAQVTAALGEPHPRQAAGAAEEAWRSFLGARYDLPAEAPPNHWPALLAKRGLGASLASELVRLVDDLHYLRYAPRLASTDSLQRELLERSRRLARRLH